MVILKMNLQGHRDFQCRISELWVLSTVGGWRTLGRHCGTAGNGSDVY